MISVRKGDYIIIIAAVLLALVLPAWRVLSGASRSGTDMVRVTEDGRVIYEGPVSEDAVIETSDGGNRIAVRGGEVYMEHAGCRDQLCVKAGKATRTHPVVCLPNGVVVTVFGGDATGGEAPYDSVSG